MSAFTLMTLDQTIADLRVVVAGIKGDVAHFEQRADSINEKLDSILEQVKLTNGRVTKLEKTYQLILGAAWAMATFAGFFGVRALIGILPR